MPSYPHIQEYRRKLQELLDYGGSDSERSIRPAFQNCLAAYCRAHKDSLALVPELSDRRNVPDGTVRDALRMSRGYWEAKDTHDDLDAEIQKKFNRGYPRDNILFEDSREAVLFQNGEEAMRVSMQHDDGELHRIIRRFLDYELPQIEEFRQAQRQFKADLPSVIDSLRDAIGEAERGSEEYRKAAADFLALCRKSISPQVSEDDVREMLLQHILTKDIFLRVFAEEQFHRENNIAARLDALERTFFVGDLRRQAIDRLRSYYGAIGRAAYDIADRAEKQSFLKAIYEDFYKTYNPAAADRLGVVYTPNEVVDFIIRSADVLLKRHFGRGIAADNVQILDPATGTGTFVTSLIDYLPPDRLERKYRDEIHANEVAILPYYIANLNIEYSYKERTGRYLEYPNLCFVDTLDNLAWKGGTGGAVQQQGALALGGISEENQARIGAQNEKPISVIIGNPPYNDSATLWGDGGANNPYPDIDKRIKETYIEPSSAQKTHQYDMYKRFIRWASDRLDDDGVIAFITNRSYIDARQDDGFRQTALKEFSDLYIVDLGGDIRKSGKVGNVFNIMTGVAIGFFVRRADARGDAKIRYCAIEDELPGDEKLRRLATMRDVGGADFADIAPDDKHNWLDHRNQRFAAFMPLADKRTKFAKSESEERAAFRLITPGIKTNRDEWVYDFDVANLRSKALFFADKYNEFWDNGDLSFNPVIKWSRDLRSEFNRGRRIVYNDAHRIRTLWRPFVVKHHFANFRMNDVLTQNHYAMFGGDLKQPNKVINICVSGKMFYALAADKPTDFHFTLDTQCLPLYRYERGKRVSNITDWALARVNEHCRAAMGEGAFAAKHPDGIGAEALFAYTYAVLHDPAYREEFQVDLLREFPRLPLHEDFAAWEAVGRELLDLHIGFETAEPYPLERWDLDGVRPPVSAILKADKERGRLRIDERTTLVGVPPSAWEYQLGSRSALEWVLDQYKERKPRDATLREEFNAYKFADHKERVIDLLGRVCAVSAKTMDAVERLSGLRRG